MLLFAFPVPQTARSFLCRKLLYQAHTERDCERKNQHRNGILHKGKRHFFQQLAAESGAGERCQNCRKQQNFVLFNEADAEPRRIDAEPRDINCARDHHAGRYKRFFT